MANPNPDVYGTSANWINATELYTAGYTGSDELKNKIPQIRNVRKDRSDLWRYVAENLLAYNTPIDPTICPCGQDPAVSAYGKIDVYRNQKNLDLNKVPDYENVYENENINWFFGSLWAANLQAPIRYCVNEIADTNQRWAPEFSNANDSNNNVFISPWVYYQTKSLLLRIKVIPLGDSAAQNSESYGSITLDEWKNNHPDKKIIGAFLEILGCSSYNSQENVIGYTGPLQGGYGSYKSINFSLLNAVNNGTSELTDYATFTFEGYNFVPLISRVIKGNGFNTTNYYYLFGYHNLDNYELKFYYSENADDGYGVYPEIGYSDHNYRQIMKMAACFGVPFTPTNKTSFNILFNDNDLYLPIIDDNGVTHGEYTHGNDNLTNDLYTKDSIRDYDYDPTRPPKPVDPNTYSITTGFNTVGAVASTTKAYVVNGAALIGLSGELWSIVGNLVTKPEDMTNLDNLALDAFLTHNPIDAIVSVKKFPLTNVPHGESLINVKLGKYTTSSGGYDLAMQQARYNFTGIQIFPKFGNCFLDYSPYTKMQLYVPFCGTIDIDAADFMGRTLSVEMCIDFTTGAVTAYVLANQLVVTSLTGNCAVDIPITGTEQATVNSALESATIAERQARHKTIMTNWGVLTHPIKTFTSPLKTLSSTIDPALNLAQREYELTHINTPLRQIGQASPLNAWELEFVCRLIIYYPDGECIQFNATNEPSLIDEKIQAFGAVNGFATVETDTLSNFTGFTQVSDADLTGVSATDTEKGMILNLLQTGVYL